MPAGLQIFNDFGTVQIDENWKNYGFRQIVPVYLETGGVDYYSLTLTGLSVLVAVRTTSMHVIPMGSLVSGTTWTFDFRYAGEFSGGAAETVYFYVFDVPYWQSYSNLGMEVFNASGERVFHSDMDVMKVPSGGVQPCNSNFYGAPGRIYAPLVLLNPIRSEFTGSNYFQSTRSLRVSGSNILSTNVPIGAGSFLEFANEGLYAAVDVTGLS